MSGKELRNKRVVHRIPGRVVSERTGIGRGRLSEIECGHVTPTPDELAGIERTIEDLIEAKNRVLEIAGDCGWPVSSL